MTVLLAAMRSKYKFLRNTFRMRFWPPCGAYQDRKAIE